MHFIHTCACEFDVNITQSVLDDNETNMHEFEKHKNIHCIYMPIINYLHLNDDHKKQ